MLFFAQQFGLTYAMVIIHALLGGKPRIISQKGIMTIMRLNRFETIISDFSYLCLVDSGEASVSTLHSQR